MEFSNHLGLCHYVVEAIAMAYHNWTFKKEETLISRLLKPHMENVIGANHIANFTLLPASDLTASVGKPVLKRTVG